jgi:hypothetical protein
LRQAEERTAAHMGTVLERASGMHFVGEEEESARVAPEELAAVKANGRLRREDGRSYWCGWPSELLK